MQTERITNNLSSGGSSTEKSDIEPPQSSDGSAQSGHFIAAAGDITARSEANGRRDLVCSVASILAEASDPDAALQQIMQMVCEFAGFALSVVWQYVPEAGELRCRSIWSVTRMGGAFEKATNAERVDACHFLPGIVLLSNEPQWVSDVGKDPNCSRMAAAANGLRGCYAFPIRIGGNVWGVMEFLRESDEKPPVSLLEMLASMGSQVGRFLERRAFESERNNLLSLLNSTLESSGEAIMVTDADGVPVHHNSHWEEFLRLLDLTPDAVMKGSGKGGKELHDHLDARIEDADLWFAHRKAMLDSPDESRNYVLQLKSGKVFRIGSTPRRIGARTVGRVWTYRDITAEETGRRMKEERLGTLRATLDSTADGILVTSLEGGPVMYNRRFRELWKIPADWPEKLEPVEFRSLATGQLLGPDAFWNKIDWLIQHPDEDGIEIAHLRDGGIYEVHTQPHRLGGKVTGRVWNCRDVTERWRDSQLLRESEASFRSLFENAPVGIYRTTPDGRIEMANPALLRLLGYESFADLSRKNLEGSGFEPEYSRETFRAKLEERGTIRGLEATWTRKDGSAMFVRENAQIVKDETGAVRYYEGFIEDVTERRRFEELLRESEIAYRRQFADNSAVMLLIDPVDGRIIDGNAAAIRFYGYDRDRLLAMRISDINLLPTEAVLQEMESVPRLEGKRFEFRHLLADGSVRDVEVATSRIQSGGSTILHSIVFDITSRKRAEEALRASEARLRSVLDNVKEVIFQTDAQGLWTFLNPSWTEITGYSLEESIGENFVNYVHPDDRQRNVELFLPLIERKKDYCRHVIRYVCKDGSSRWIEVFARLTLDSQGAVGGTSGTLTDVTQRVEAAAALERAKDAAEAADRAKSEFLANVSHEIRTPLNAIIGLTELLRESQLNSDQQDMLQTIWASSESLFHLINDLLEVSRIEAGQVDVETREFDLREACEQAVEIIYPRARQQGLQLFCVLQHWNPPTLAGDPHRLRQVLLNLLNNAVKFTERGHVTLRAGWDLSRPGFADVRISVEDTGAGIAPEEQQRIFEKFIRVDSPLARKAGGAGLGLSITRSLARAMGGSVELVSQPGAGSTFCLTLTLPVTSTAGGNAVEGLRSSLLLSVPPRAKILAPVCRGAGLDVRTCMSAAEALDVAERETGIEAVAIDTEFAWEPADALRFHRLLSLSGNRARPDSGEVAGSYRQAVASAGPVEIIFLTGTENEPLPAWADSLPIRRCGLPLTPTRIRRALGWEAGGVGVVAGPSVSPRTGGTQRAGAILLVEDNPDTRAYVLRVLGRGGHRVTVATTGGEAVDAASQRSFDVILMDVMLPDMTGFEATRKIRELEVQSGRPKETIIALTAHALQGYRQQAFASDMNDYLTKPVRMKTLLATLDRWLGGNGGDGGSAGASAAGVAEENSTAAPDEVHVDPDIADLVPGYLVSTRRALEEVAVMAAGRDAAGIRRHAHNIAGSGDSYGFEELTRLAGQMGAAARADDFAAAGKLANAGLEYLGHVRWSVTPS